MIRWACHTASDHKACEGRHKAAHHHPIRMVTERVCHSWEIREIREHRSKKMSKLPYHADPRYPVARARVEKVDPTEPRRKVEKLREDGGRSGGELPAVPEEVHWTCQIGLQAPTSIGLAWAPNKCRSHSTRPQHTVTAPPTLKKCRDRRVEGDVELRNYYYFFGGGSKQIQGHDYPGPLARRRR